MKSKDRICEKCQEKVSLKLEIIGTDREYKVVEKCKCKMIWKKKEKI